MNETVKIEAPMKSIAAALSKAQAEMGKALKQSENPHFRSKYADLGAVMDACLPALNKHGIAVIQPTIDDDSGRYVETVLIHDSGEELRCRVPLIVSKNDMQGYGSAVTYARRYGLMCMAGIAPEDDDGNAAAKAAPDPKAEYEAAVSQAIRGIESEKDLESLGEFWADLNRKNRRVAEDRRVIDAKDKRKVALNPKGATDLGGDEIPY